MTVTSTLRKPAWLKSPISGGQEFSQLHRTIREHKLHTVCEEARCPNKAHCWSKGVATLMILGDTCTRACGFCNVKTGRPGIYDREEPLRVAKSVQLMNLRYLTLTSVDRDDLEDMGSEVWSETIRRVLQAVPNIQVEVLIPDFQGRLQFVDAVLDAGPHVLNHNMETVRRLQKSVRKFANWNHSRTVLAHAKSRGWPTKTGLMLGLGETEEEIHEFIDEMAELRIDILTFGQYLQPTPKHLAVQRYYSPAVFADLARRALAAGIAACESGPLVRSSYHAEESGLPVLNVHNSKKETL